MTKAQQLNIKEFPFIIKNKDGNIIYQENSDGYWYKMEYDDDGNKIYRENSHGLWYKIKYDNDGNTISSESSNGYWYKIEYDDDGNRIYHENNSGVLWDRRLKPVPEYTMEELTAKLGHNFKIKNYKAMNEIYQQIKSECELPVAVLTYTYKDFDGVLHPFASIAVSFRDSDEINIEKMEKVKSKYGEFFMFFNNSTEGREFWKNNPITITQKK